MHDGERIRIKRAILSDVGIFRNVRKLELYGLKDDLMERVNRAKKKREDSKGLLASTDHSAFEQKAEIVDAVEDFVEKGVWKVVFLRPGRPSYM